MSERGAIRAVLAITVTAIVASLIWLVFSEIGHRRERAALAASTPQQAVCLPTPHAGALDCTLADTGAPAEVADLHAQQDMATWALGMFLATVFTTGLTGLGVFLLWRTLRSTNETLAQAEEATKAAYQAANVTRTIGEAQTRGYPGVSDLTIDISAPAHHPSSSSRIKISMRLTNSGASPLSLGILRWKATAEVTTGDEIITEVLAPLGEIASPDQVYSQEISEIAAQGQTVETIEADNAFVALAYAANATIPKKPYDSLEVFVEITLEYRDVFDRRIVLHFSAMDSNGGLSARPLTYTERPVLSILDLETGHPHNL